MTDHHIYRYLTGVYTCPICGRRYQWPATVLEAGDATIPHVGAQNGAGEATDDDLTVWQRFIDEETP